MYVYCIYDEEARLYFLGMRRASLPVPTCIWGSDMADAVAYDSAMAATLTLRQIGAAASVYRLRRDGKGPARRVRVAEVGRAAASSGAARRLPTGNRARTAHEMGRARGEATGDE